jgi:hypothetical protein
LSEKEENKYLYERLTNAYAIRTKVFGMANFGGGAPTEERNGPGTRTGHAKESNPLIGVALIVALLVCLALLFLHR